MGKAAHFPLAPRLGVRGDVPFDRARMLRIYARERVGHAWLVLTTFMGDERIRAEPFAEIELPLSALWIDG